VFCPISNIEPMNTLTLIGSSARAGDPALNMSEIAAVAAIWSIFGNGIATILTKRGAWDKPVAGTLQDRRVGR
jgi:hypothetical protein